jgi:hypothetical protein
MHISIFINNWVVFYTMGQAEYSFQKVILTILGNCIYFYNVLKIYRQGTNIFRNFNL